MAKIRHKPVIIAIFLAYNAASTLKDFYKAFPKHLVHEIILVDDASKDNTFKIAKKLGITAYRNKKNLGYGGNLKRCLAFALDHGADIIIDLHPDAEYKPSAILPALKKIESGAEFILGNRFTTSLGPIKTGMHSWKFIPLLCIEFLSRLILDPRIKDYHQGFRIYTRKLLEKVDFESNSDDYLFSFELIAQAVYRKSKIKQVYVETYYTGGKRGASFKSSVLYAIGVFKILLLFILAKLGVKISLFRKTMAPINKRIKRLL